MCQWTGAACLCFGKVNVLLLMNCYLVFLFAYRRQVWEQLEAIQRNPKRVTIQDLTSEIARERLETRDRVVRLELGFSHLVVATTKQLYIFRYCYFSLNNVNINEKCSRISENNINCNLLLTTLNTY